VPVPPQGGGTAIHQAFGFGAATTNRSLKVEKCRLLQRKGGARFQELMLWEFSFFSRSVGIVPLQMQTMFIRVCA
jgi:hypothetical protein